MSDWTKTSFNEIDAGGDESAPVIAKFGRKHIDSSELGVSHFTYKAGTKPTFGHRHREQEEAYVVVGGSGQVRLDDEVIDLNQWDVIRVAPDVVRGFRAGPDGLELIAVGSDRPEGGDGAIVKDWWTD